MAHTANQTTPFETKRENILMAGLRAIGTALVNVAETNSRVHKIQALQNLSNDQLTERGIRREDIVRHVFRDQMYL